MAFPVLVESVQGQFTAMLAGVPDVRVVGSTRSEAVQALRTEITQLIERGELLSLEIGPVSISSLAGKYADDPTLREICDHAYRQRDAEQTE